MSKIGNHVIGMQEYGTFSAWSADGKSEVTLDGPVNPDRLVYADSFEMETIKITVENGCVIDVENLPENYNYEIIDHDIIDNEKEIPDYKSGGSIAFVEPEEIEVILELSKTLKAGRNKRVLELLYERLK